MRGRRLLFLLPASVLALGGGVLAYVANTAPSRVPGLLPATKHPITAKMAADAAAASRTVAPRIATLDAYGKPLVLGGPRSRPQFVYFIMKACPCSYDVEPFYQQLAKAYSKQVDFVAVTDGSHEDAKRWNTEMSEPYPIASDPTLSAMRRFGAKASVYAALVDVNGRIVKLWPGYSKGIVAEMGATIAREVGVKPAKLNLLFAPKEKTAGCAFFASSA